jgi:dolichyl-phosphate-mannose--protein O-mannosyl transferase
MDSDKESGMMDNNEENLIAIDSSLLQGLEDVYMTNSLSTSWWPLSNREVYATSYTTSTATEVMMEAQKAHVRLMKEKLEEYNRKQFYDLYFSKDWKSSEILEELNTVEPYQSTFLAKGMDKFPKIRPTFGPMVMNPLSVAKIDGIDYGTEPTATPKPVDKGPVQLELF